MPRFLTQRRHCMLTQTLPRCL